MNNRYLLLVLVFALYSCAKKLDSVEILSEFVKYRTTSGQSVEKIKSYTTGQFLKSIEDMEKADPDKLLKAESDHVKFAVLFKRCEEKSCTITYQVRYGTKDSSGQKYEVESKKIAEMLLENEQWKIFNITNVKTYIEGQEIKDQ